MNKVKRKAAICISGHMREYKQGFENLSKYIIQSNPEYDFDIFIDTWFAQDWHGTGANELINEELNKIVSTYMPTSIQIQKPIYLIQVNILNLPNRVMLKKILLESIYYQCFIRYLDAMS